ncbi:Telomerase reverse transcriptase [Frankliniella fusca]|uniref:Telomerase reverse transcriptase n=1 Tax=Frankliniella fusca TaxID=407009 RepID=A0AAE1HT90_9NEOP|nr:Telomerase reverse transcriptase [Frankliniella fusca]
MEARGAKKKKTRRKKSSKCSPTSPFSIEKTPFKDEPNNGININDSFKPTFPHALNQTPIDKVTSFQLVNNILAVKVGVNIKSLLNDEIKKSVDLGHLACVLEKFLRQHKRLYVYRNVALRQIKVLLPDHKSSENYSRKVVFHILFFILSKVFPSELLGSKTNFKLFMKSVRRVVYGCQHQCLSLSSVVHGLKVSHIQWLQKAVPSNSLRLHVFACLVKWLVLYVQVTISRLFHLAVHASNEILFYDKEKWLRLKEREIKNLLLNNKIVPAENTDTSKFVDIGSTQFRVKKHGLRPITIFRKPSDTASILLRLKANMLLHQLAFANGAQNTTFNIRIDQMLQNGLRRVVGLYPDPVSRPPYYFVRADVKDAFGSVNHYKMNSILQDLNKQFLPADAMMKVWSVKKGNKVITMFESTNLALPTSVTLSKIGQPKTEKIIPILLHIRNHVHRLATQFGKSVFRISHGIPQGMHLSAILCEIYYNALDLKHFHAFRKVKEGEIFLRYCDDYLFLTPDKERAEMFLRKVSEGFTDFSVHFNNDKTLTNLSSDTFLIPFCGFRIDLSTFSVQSCFDAYESANIANTLSLSKTNKLGKSLLFRMKIVLKLNPILVDKRLNSKLNIVQNIYNSALFMAFRFCAFVHTCFPPKKVNQKFILNCVKVGERTLRKRVLRLVRKSATGNWISPKEIRWIVYQAFFARMSKSEVWCKTVLNYLRKTCEAISKELNTYQLKLLQSAKSPALPGVFSTMK